jgi:hypothetical protein
MNDALAFLPQARRTSIIRKKVEGELLVYDLTRDKAHCLNESAAAIWTRCDGHTSVKEIAASLAKEVESTVDERVVWLALADLRRIHLLEEPKPLLEEEPRESTGGQDNLQKNGSEKSQKQRPQSGPWPEVMLGMSRREAVKRIGLGAAIALPVIVSITSPTAAHAGSCLPSGASCGAPIQCCSGICNGGVCG